MRLHTALQEKLSEASGLEYWGISHTESSEVPEVLEVAIEAGQAFVS